MFEFETHPLEFFQLHEHQTFRLVHPLFVTGFVDGEGSFGIYLKNRSKYHLGWSVEPVFQLGLHEKDEQILREIREFVDKAGSIYKKGSSVFWRVESLEQISNIIIPHFDKYSLITQKHADYLLFKQVILIIKRKEHLTKDGLQAIVNIRATLNKGLRHWKKLFPSVFLFQDI